jgi:hypothetical protein
MSEYGEGLYWIAMWSSLLGIFQVILTLGSAVCVMVARRPRRHIAASIFVILMSVASCTVQLSNFKEDRTDMVIHATPWFWVGTILCLASAAVAWKTLQSVLRREFSYQD